MYIVFKLPHGAGGMAALHVSNQLKKRVESWAQLHNITITNQLTGYRICFKLAKPEDYTLFALSWTVTSIWDEYALVDSVNT